MIKILFIIFLILQLIDIASTFYLLTGERKGKYKEANKIINYIAKYIGVFNTILLLKFLLIIIVYIAILYLSYMNISLLCINGIYLYLMIRYNIKSVLKEIMEKK